jgi:hypothetical protein
VGDDHRLIGHELLEAVWLALRIVFFRSCSTDLGRPHPQAACFVFNSSRAQAGTSRAHIVRCFH